MSGAAANIYDLSSQTNGTPGYTFNNGTASGTNNTSYPTIPSGGYLAPDVSGLYGTTFTASTGVSGGRAAIVAPFKGEYTGTTTASIGVTDMTAQTYFTGIDSVFKITLSEAESINLLNCFFIQDDNTLIPEGALVDGVYKLEGKAGSFANGVYTFPTLSQDTANFHVDLAGVSEFKRILTNIVLPTAVEQFGKQLPSVTAYFQEEMRVEMNLQLKNSGLLDMLEASNVTNVQVSLQFANGADSIATAIGATGTEAADKRRQFLTQIPLSTLESYMGEVQPALGYLPLSGADSITFVFDITVSAPSTLASTPNNIYDGAANAYKAPNIGAINMDSERRRCAFVVSLTDSLGGFARDFASAIANETVAPTGWDAVPTKAAEAEKVVKALTTKLVVNDAAYIAAYSAFPSSVDASTSYADHIKAAAKRLATADAARRSGVAAAQISSIA